MSDIHLGTVVHIPQKKRAIYKVVNVDSNKNEFFAMACGKDKEHIIQRKRKMVYKLRTDLPGIKILGEGKIEPMNKIRVKKTIIPLGIKFTKPIMTPGRFFIKLFGG